MELSDLVHSLKSWALVTVLGGSLYAVVPTPEPVRPGLIGPVSDDELLLAEARFQGWAATDPIVRQHLIKSLDFVYPEAQPDTLIALAAELNLADADPVVRARLLSRARRSVLAANEVPATLDDLQQHLDAYPERFTRPARVRYERRFTGKEGVKRPDHGTPPQGVDDQQSLASMYGEEIAAVVMRTAPGQWTPPLTNRRGSYTFHVLDVTPPATPPLAQITAEVRSDWRKEHEKEWMDAGLRKLREAWQ